MANIVCKSFALILVVWMLIGAVISKPMADQNVPMVAGLAAKNTGFRTSGLRGCNSGAGGGRPGAPASTTTTTTAATG